MNEQLIEILKKMEVPEFRRRDIYWLARNLGIRNREHPDFDEASKLIKREIMNDAPNRRSS